MIKKIILILIPLILVIGHTSKRLHFWYQSKQELAQIQEELDQTATEEDNLLQKKEYYQTEEYIRREAREKLGMIKDNEAIVVLPEMSGIKLPLLRGERYENLPVWKQWYQLFFGNRNS